MMIIINHILIQNIIHFIQINSITKILPKYLITIDMWIFPSKSNWYDNLYKTIYPFVKQRRPKKINFFVGVDKLERLEIYKYIHNIGLDKESHLVI